MVFMTITSIIRSVRYLNCPRPLDLLSLCTSTTLLELGFIILELFIAAVLDPKDRIVELDDISLKDIIPDWDLVFPSGS